MRRANVAYSAGSTFGKRAFWKPGELKRSETTYRRPRTNRIEGSTVVAVAGCG
jgi:hypothetical protein